MRRPIIAVAKLLAGARAIVVFVEALPDQVGAEPWCRFECDRRAKRPKIAAVDVVLGGRGVIITAAAGHRTRDAASKHVVDHRHVGHRQLAPAVLVADPSLKLALQPADIGLGDSLVNDAAGTVPAAKRPPPP